MYSNDRILTVGANEKLMLKAWHRTQENQKKFTDKGKYFVECICPKCSVRHQYYMMWTGRGVPRKYCGNCKPIVSGLDETAYCEVSFSKFGRLKKRGRSYDSE